MPARKRLNQSETYTTLRGTSGTARFFSLDQNTAFALAKLVYGCLVEGHSIYFRRNRDDSITVRIYAGDERYEEVISPNEDLDLASEEIVEALAGLDLVASMRRQLAPKRAERAAEARNGVGQGDHTREGGKDALKASQVP